LLLGVSSAVLLVCLLHFLLPAQTSQHLNSQIAIIPQKNQQPRFIGRAVLGEESRTQEENTSRLPTNQQQTPTQATEEHLVRKPQLRVE
jgi:hypothetical protein